MIVVNRHPLGDAVVPLLRFAARGIATTGLLVEVKRDDYGPHGAYYEPSIARTVDPRPCPIGAVRLLFPGSPGSPTWPGRWWNTYGLVRLARAYPCFPLDGWADVVVYLAAHEFRHAWQYQRRLADRRAGKRPKRRCEADASRHGLEAVNRFRVHTGREPIPRIKQPNPFAFRQEAV